MTLLSVVLSATCARAQGFDGQRYLPPVGSAGGLLVERAEVPTQGLFGAGVFLDFADDPVILSDPNTGQVLSRPVASLFVVDLTGSLAVLDRLELAVDVPVFPVYQGDDFGALSAAPGFGDVRLVPKGLILQSDRGFQLGAALPLSLPTGDAEALRGSGEVWVEPEVLLGLRASRLSAYGSGGFRARPGIDPLDPVGNELTFGAGVSYAIVSDQLDLLVEGSGAADLTRGGPQLTDLPLEALAGVEWQPARDWVATAGGGPGLTDGLGTPDFRVVGGVRYVPRPVAAPIVADTPVDTDADQVLDVDDSCPTVPEDRDGYLDKDGCPEPDNDEDGILDDKDECPQVPEEPGGDGDGCPEKSQVRLTPDRIEVDGKILFSLNSATVDSRSDPLLDQIAGLLKEHPEVGRVIIQGNTDDTGDDAYNDDLSERRAESVSRALVARGIAGDRLVPKGFGERRPIAPNDTPAGRASNRRVEFLLKE